LGNWELEKLEKLGELEKLEKVPRRCLPTRNAESYRSALLRVTIAIVVSFALAPHWAAAALQNAAPGEGHDPEAAASAEPERPSRGSTSGPVPATVPSQPFSETGDDSGADDADADVGADQAQDETIGAPLRALSCLEGEGGNDQDGARRGVQKRDFMKKRRVEIAAMGGYYASDALSSTYIYGGAASFFLSEDFGVELLVTRNPVTFRLEDPFNSFDRERHFQAGNAWNVLGAMSWSPVHAKLRWGEQHITHADLLLVAGAGRTAHQSVQGLTFQAGLEIKLYLTRFVSLRLDVRDLMVPQEVLGQGRTTHNLVTMIGVCAWVPG
jgi:outer membrane beta-barrel protein